MDGLEPHAKAEKTDAGRALTWMGFHCTVGWELSPQVMNQNLEASNEAGSTRMDLGLSRAFEVYHLLSSPSCLLGSASEGSTCNSHFNTEWATLRYWQSGKLHLT